MSFEKSLILTCALFCFVKPVHADPCSDRDPTAHRHDGFFLRADTSLTGFFATVSGSPIGRTRITGIGEGASVLLGGTPMPGLVVGGSLWASRIDPSFVERGVHVTPDDDSVKITLGRIGPFVDWYPNPSQGFHLQTGMALVLAVESDTKGNSIKPGGVGGAGTFAAGYEWFLGPQFSLGFLARFVFGAWSRSLPGRDEATAFQAPELALTSTYQ